MNLLKVILASALVGPSTAFLKSRLCDDWDEDKVFEAYGESCDEVYKRFDGGDRSFDDICVDSMSDGSPTGLTYASNCCLSQVSNCPVLPLCMNEEMYNPTAVAFGESKCGELSSQWAYTDADRQCASSADKMASFASFCCSDGVSICPVSQLCSDESNYNQDAIVFEDDKCANVAHQWAYSDLEVQCNVRNNEMASWASKCCDDGMSICPVSQLCAEESYFNPFATAFGDTTCGMSAHKWNYDDLEAHCGDNDVEMAYYANLCCLDGLSVCPVSPLCENPENYLPFADYDQNQKCYQLAPQWTYTDLEDKCTYNEAQMNYFADACCIDGISACPVSPLCKDDSQYNPRASVFTNQRCSQVAQEWTYDDEADQCDPIFGKKPAMDTYAFHCCKDYESVCGFFQICQDPTMFTPERGVDGKKYNSNSGIMRCAEIAAELTSEYTKQDSFCLDGSIPDFMDKTLSLPDVFAFECCSDQISVCAATATLKVTLELSSLSPPLAKDEAVLKQDIASLLGVETSEFANYEVSFEEVQPIYFWTVTFSLPQPIPSFGSVSDTMSAVKSKLESTAFQATLQESLGVTVVEVLVSSPDEEAADNEADHKETSTLTILASAGASVFVLFCAAASCMLPSKNKASKPEPAPPPAIRRKRVQKQSPQVPQSQETEPTPPPVVVVIASAPGEEAKGDSA